MAHEPCFINHAPCEGPSAQDYRLHSHELTVRLENAAYLSERATISRRVFQSVRDQDEIKPTVTEG